MKIVTFFKFFLSLLKKITQNSIKKINLQNKNPPRRKSVAQSSTRRQNLVRNGAKKQSYGFSRSHGVSRANERARSVLRVSSLLLSHKEEELTLRSFGRLVNPLTRTSLVRPIATQVPRKPQTYQKVSSGRTCTVKNQNHAPSHAASKQCNRFRSSPEFSRSL
jgi:hypothetical protein